MNMSSSFMDPDGPNQNGASPSSRDLDGLRSGIAPLFERVELEESSATPMDPSLEQWGRWGCDCDCRKATPGCSRIDDVCRSSAGILLVERRHQG